ncbi:phosphoglucosamine mutase [Paenibacillus qinlingensis]|uniref:Phosphoglucosamine mutase n=1 Tax=Paenibacillus qinlingensis TaxID=1837343 RepID=A0ABU1P4L5_9BACL|nr:phosphoglucosamine mutase [Paenibacillus qinlingensis]MDR6554681.1 phosphoglucosamine mutase [Paenibacillus qinlingensis]
MGAIFGTDGVRGVANRGLTPELAFELGLIVGYMLTRSCEGNRPTVAIGRDTRISGHMLEAALTSGLLSAGADVVRLGVLPTPGVAYVTRQSSMDAGVMISASHNPVEDNGIKFFGSDGFKMPDAWEAEVELRLQGDEHRSSRPTGAAIGTLRDDPQGAQDYVSYLKSTAAVGLSGCKIVLDCANGAASVLAPQLFAELGAETVLMYHEPDGLNINQDCGSTHPEHLRKAVLAHSAHVGLSFDGDADRLIAVDERGEILDGDHILYILAAHLAKQGRLRHNTVVSTVMSNLGFHQALQTLGLDSYQSKVGDRHVMEAMQSGGYNLGGESSGHIILLDDSTTGDGMLAALQLLQVMLQAGKPLSELVSPVVKYPQLVVNVRVIHKYKLEGNGRIDAVIRRVESEMAGRGRVLVRPSGTEALVRVMAEGPDERELSGYVEGIVEVVKEELEYSMV